MNEADVTPDELAALKALSVAASQLLAAARAAGNVQTEAIAACAVTSLGLINTPAGQPRATYLKRVAEIIFELAVAASDPPSPRDAS